MCGIFSMRMGIEFDTGYFLVIDLFDNDFVCRWAKLLRHELKLDTLLQQDTFSSFCSEQQARQRLEQAIDQVNAFLKLEFIAVPKSEDYEDPTFYNQLHEKFEKLAGPDWSKPSRLMIIAPESVKLAVRHINRYCHRLERRPYKQLDHVRVEFNTSRRKLLKPDDIAMFKPVHDHNTVVLDYSTLGKSLYECFEDRLAANYAGMKLQQHYCANFILQFEPQKPNPAFVDWCASQGIIDIPLTERGQLCLGKIVDKNCFEKVEKAAKITSITLE